MNPHDHDIFELRAVVDGVSAFGVQLSRNKTFTKCAVCLPNGVGLCFVERDLDTIRFYADASRTTELLRVAPRKRRGLRSLWSGPMHDVSDPDGKAIGVIHKVFGERQYEVGDMRSETEPIIVIQEPETSIKEWARSSRPFSNDRFAFWDGTRRLGSLVPHPARTDSTLDMTPDSGRAMDRRLGLAVSCLDLLRERDEGGGG